MFARLALLFFMIALISAPTNAQTTAPVRDPQALNLISSSLAAMTGGAALNDVTLKANVSYAAGSDVEKGTAILVGHVNQESNMQLTLSGGIRQEIRNGPAGVWSGPDATVHSISTHNCFTDATWFFPALTLEAIANNPQVSVSYLGPDSSKGVTFLVLEVALVPPGQSASVFAPFQSLSTMEIYFDPKLLLPVVLDFYTHPDVDATRDLCVEILFGNYQNSNGWLAPFHIQKYFQTSLLLDLTVTNVLVNSGVPDSTFTLPVVTAGGAQ